MLSLLVIACIVYLIVRFFRVPESTAKTSSESQPPKETVVDNRPWWEKPSNYEDFEKLKDYAYLFRKILPAIVAQKGSIGIYCSDSSNTLFMSIRGLDQVSDLYAAVQSKYASDNDTLKARNKYNLTFDQMDILRKMERRGTIWESEHRAETFFHDDWYRAMAEIIKAGVADSDLYTIEEERTSGFSVKSKSPYN